MTVFRYIVGGYFIQTIDRTVLVGSSCFPTYSCSLGLYPPKCFCALFDCDNYVNLYLCKVQCHYSVCMTTFAGRDPFSRHAGTPRGGPAGRLLAEHIIRYFVRARQAFKQLLITVYLPALCSYKSTIR